MDQSKTDTAKSKKPNINIRQMDIDDLAPVFHLGEKLFTARKVPNLYRTWDEHEVIDLFHADTEYCLIAEIENRIVGFALGTTVKKSHSAWKYGYLVWLGSDPEYQGMGVASKLFVRFRELMLADGVRILLIDTEADNLPALRFFRKRGFGSPQEHIYLSLNIDPQRHLRDKKPGPRPAMPVKENGRTSPPCLENETPREPDCHEP